MEIESHKFLLTGAIIVTILTIGSVITYRFGAQIWEVATSVGSTVVTVLQPIVELIGTAVKVIGDAVVDALAGVAHDIIGALSGLAAYLGQSLQPFLEMLMGVGAVVVNAFINFMGPLLDSFISVATGFFQSLWDFMLTIPIIGDIMLGFAEFFNWMMISVVGLVTAISGGFTLFTNAMVGIYEMIAMWIGWATQVYNTIVDLYTEYSELGTLLIFCLFIELTRESVEGNTQPLISILSITFGVISWILAQGMRLAEFIADRIFGGLPV